MSGPTPEELEDAINVDAILGRLPAAMARAFGTWPVGDHASRTADLAALTVVPTDPPALEAIDVTWPDGTYKVFPDRVEWTVNHPDGLGWTDQLDVMVASPDGVPDTSLTALYEWAAQRALETRMLEDMAAILKARPVDAPGVILFRQPGPETVMLVESPWLPAGTLIYSAPDQPDLMVKLDPDRPGVLYYRQGPAV